MENKYNQLKEAEALGNAQTAVPYVISVPASNAAPGMAPPVYCDTPGQRWSWCNLVTSVISLFCCACFGVVATVMAMASYTDHKARDFARAQRKRQWAYGFAISAIVIGSICLIGYIIMMVFFVGMDGPYDRHGRDRFPSMYYDDSK